MRRKNSSILKRTSYPPIDHIKHHHISYTTDTRTKGSKRAEWPGQRTQGPSNGSKQGGGRSAVEAQVCQTSSTAWSGTYLPGITMKPRQSLLSKDGNNLGQTQAKGEVKRVQNQSYSANGSFKGFRLIGQSDTHASQPEHETSGSQLIVSPQSTAVQICNSENFASSEMVLDKYVSKLRHTQGGHPGAPLSPNISPLLENSYSGISMEIGRMGKESLRPEGCIDKDLTNECSVGFGSTENIVTTDHSAEMHLSGTNFKYKNCNVDTLDGPQQNVGESLICCKVKVENKIYVPFVNVGAGNVECLVCCKLMRKSSFANHKQTHTEETVFQCEVCQKGFKRKDYLLKHMNKHSDVKNFFCLYCGRGFGMKQSLTSHMQVCKMRTDPAVPTGKELIYKCPHCTHRFKKIDSLYEHLKAHKDAKQ